jgi:ACR3 family arsenite efflux pump ArsB
MYPILCKVRFESLHHVFKTRQIWIQIAFSIVVNWIIAPFFMVRLQYFHFLSNPTPKFNTEYFSWRYPGLSFQTNPSYARG